jgi:hypothetical protein
MKASCILSFTFSTLNIVWEKLGRGGALASWLVGPFVANLAPIGYTSCNVVSLAIRAPICTFYVLHQSTWLSAQLLTHVG